MPVGSGSGPHSDTAESMLTKTVKEDQRRTRTTSGRLLKSELSEPPMRLTYKSILLLSCLEGL